MLTWHNILMNKLTLNNALILLIFASIIFFISHQLILPLWHDELYQLWIISKDFNSIIAITREDPNYPLQSIIYKFLFDLVGIENYENLVFIHFFSLVIVLFSLFLLRKIISFEKIIMFAIILFSSEFFLRFFFELRSYGFVFSWSVLFSSSYLLTKLRDENFYFYLLLISGLVLSALHAIAGLFVVTVMLKLIIETRHTLKRFFALALIFISCSFVLIFSSGSVIGNNQFWIDSYFNHIRNTGAFMIPAIIAGFLILTEGREKNFSKFLYDISPIIFSIIIIFTYSILTSPIYQGRYFTTFFPFLSLFLIYHLHSKHFLILKITSLFFVIVLYGPRAITPYTHLEGIIENSHQAHCKGMPLFFENESGFDSEIKFKRIFDEIVYEASQQYYSDIKRPVYSAKDAIKWWNNNYKNNSCKVVGVTTRDIIPDLSTFLKEKNNFILSKKLVDGCNENNCGIIWYKN